MPKHRSKRDRITIQQPVYSTDDYNHKKLTSHTDVAGLDNLHATWEHTGGVETFRGRQIEAGISGVFEIRKTSVDIKPNYRVKHLSDSDKLYEVISVRPAEGKFEGGFSHQWVFVKGVDDV